MSRESQYKNSKMAGVSQRQYATTRAHSMAKGVADNGGADRRDRPAKFFDGSELKPNLLINFAKLPIFIRFGESGFRFRCGVWAGILMRLPSRTVEEICITTELPGPRLFQALLTKAAQSAEVADGGVESLTPHVVTNDGQEFRRSRAAAELINRLGLKVSYLPPYRLPSKGAVERFFSALDQQLLKPLPGYDGIRKRSQSATSDGTAGLLTLQQLQEAVEEWVAANNLIGT